ncbi:MAG: phosphotyrosine protein phosphatase, partial [Micavibrio sp.]|nr:phosphotyrosine protein phosphatase [Micavibrio sp.]
MKSVLFVCTGNICRSPSADGILRHLANAKGLALRIDSCGTHGYHIGEPPDHRSIETARAKGVDLSSLRARKLAPQDFEAFDILFAMDQGHMRIL